MVNVQMLTELEEVIQYKLVVDQRQCIKYVSPVMATLSFQHQIITLSLGFVMAFDGWNKI